MLLPLISVRPAFLSTHLFGLVGKSLDGGVHFVEPLQQPFQFLYCHCGGQFPGQLLLARIFRAPEVHTCMVSELRATTLEWADM